MTSNIVASATAGQIRVGFMTVSKAWDEAIRTVAVFTAPCTAAPLLAQTQEKEALASDQGERRQRLLLTALRGGLSVAIIGDDGLRSISQYGGDEVLLLGPPRLEDGVEVADYAWLSDGKRAGRFVR